MLFSKILTALFRLPHSLRPTPAPRLVMTLLVKNEEAMLEANLCFHHAMGVDAFVVTDNNSTDRTPEIIERYKQKGWIVEAIDEAGQDYKQKLWVDRMVTAAIGRHGADWVINADADELWYAPSGNIKTELTTTHANVLVVHPRCVLPEEGMPFYQWTQAVNAVPEERMEEFDLSPYSIFSKQRQKVMHRADGYIQIAMGNHKVVMLPRRKAECNLAIYHYTTRDRAGFLEKMINGGAQLANNPSKHGGRHWRYFYNLYLEGKLEAEYERVVGGGERRLPLERAGFVETDTTIKDFFENMKAERL